MAVAAGLVQSSAKPRLSCGSSVSPVPDCHSKDIQTGKKAPGLVTVEDSDAMSDD